MDAIERMRGWRSSLSEHGLVAREPLSSDWSPRSAYAIGLKLLEERDFTAVFAGNDQLALGLLHAFTERGVRVPEDVSLVGYDDIPEAEHFTPPLTTVRQDFAGLGRDIMSTLVEILLDEEPVETPHTAPELVVRKSTAPPES